MCGPIWLVAFLPILTACSTNRPALVTSSTVIREQVPAVLVRPCPPRQRKPLVTTADIVNRLTYTEAALATCSAQVDGVRAWGEGQK